VVEHTSRHPEIFCWLNLHTFGGVLIRPLGHAPDSKMDPFDLALYRQLSAWVEEHSGYPSVSGYEEFLYEPDKPLHGDVADYAYHQRGALAYTIELWDLFHQLGLPRKKPFVDHYTHLGREDLARLWRWDAEHNQGRIHVPWRPCQHPQLGAVETGGFDPRFGIWNPPVECLDEICRGQAAAYLRVLAMAPVLRLRGQSEPVGAGLWRVHATVENLGYLPTYVLGSARKLEFAEPLVVEALGDELLAGGSGCQVLPEARREMGHLEGWGRGLFSPQHGIGYAHSSGNASLRRTSFLCQGQGRLRLRAGSCRTGWVEVSLELG
jgi:hypothetical protein